MPSATTDRHKYPTRSSPVEREPLDRDTGLLKRDRLLLQNTQSAEIFLGLGSRFILYKQLVEVGQFIKQYNNNETRDQDGRWATNGGTANAALSAAAVAPAPATGPAGVGNLFGKFPNTPSLLQRLGATALEVLGDFAAAFAAPAAFLGAYIIPLGRSAVASGTLPDHPGIDYHYDSDTGHFTLYTNDSNIDDRQTLFTGVAGADGLIRTQEGDVVGRRVDGSVIVDMDRLGSVLAAQVDDAADETGAIAIAQAQTTTEDPKLCPDPEPDVPGNKSARSVAYQEFVSSFVNPEHPIPLGFAVYYFNPETGRYVALDDCDQSNGEPVEAKGYGFARMLQNPIVQKFLGMRFLSQANRQVDASSGRPIRWCVAEPEAAAYIRTLFSRPKLSSIQVFNLPAPMLKIMVWWRNFPNTLQQSEEQLA